MATITKKQNENDMIINKLESKISQIEGLKKEGKDGPNFVPWKKSIIRLLERISGSGDKFSRDFETIKYAGGPIRINSYEYDIERAFLKGLDEAKRILEEILEEIKDFGIPTTVNNHIVENNDKNNVTVNLNQNINITINSVLKNHLSLEQYQEAKTILEIGDQKQKDSKLSEFLINLGSTGLVEIIKGLLLGG